MEKRSTTEYVQLSNKIFVPKEWPVRGIQTFLLKLAETMIENVTSDELIILQVRNIPTMLIQREENYETQYFFERISHTELFDAYIIDVVFNKNDKNFFSETNSVESEDSSKLSASDTYNSHEGISLDDYVIVTNQSENRTAYYFIPAEKNVQTLNPERKSGGEMQQYSPARAKR